MAATDTTISGTDAQLASQGWDVASTGVSNTWSSISNAFGNPASLLTGTMQSGNLTTNPNYQVTLTQNGTNLTVIGNAPQDFDFNLTNEYTSLMQLAGTFGVGTASVSNTAGNILKGSIGVATALGVGQAKAGTVQVWNGTSPLEFTLPISFRAYSDPLADVINPLRMLIQMASPTSTVGFLMSPGPSLADAFGSAFKSVASSIESLLGGTANTNSGASFLSGLNKAITLRFGSGIVVPGLIITGLHVKMGSRAARGSGLPISAEATVSLRTFMVFSQNDVLNMFYGGAAAAAANIVSSAVSGQSSAAAGASASNAG